MKLRNYFLIFIIILIGIFIFQNLTIDETETENNFVETSDSILETSIEISEEVKFANITQDRIVNADKEPGNWLSYGRNYEEQRFSPLTQINKETIKDLELAWSFDMNSSRALESTPIVENGVMFLTSEWSIVYAIDARTGTEIWSYDPEVPKDWGRKACCDVVNRGVAVWKGHVFSATLDGRLIKLDAKTGELIWEINTLIDRSSDYTITGAPRISNNKVFIGNGGAEYGVRGYVSAYDTETSELVWRFYTVPGNPSLPFEHPEMELAAETWKGGEWWKIGGGGTVWNSIVYDPDFNQLYLGVGNGSPWTRVIRSPGGGDNLFLSSIVALDADTGKMKWYYQTTPGDNWDYTAVQDMMLADMEVDGIKRKILMQAPKNGFFYVLDRKDGKLLRAHNYVSVNWATHVDMETGRPVENMEKDYLKEKQVIIPGPLGGHNWQAMSYDPNLGLVYIPALEAPMVFKMTEEWQKTGKLKYEPRTWNLGIELAKYIELALDTPELPAPHGFLKAFDPLTGKTRWVIDHPNHWNGGTLATKSGIVFQGNGMGTFDAYDSETGQLLWSKNIQTSIIAPPVTFEVDGEQYLAILAGTGGADTFGGDQLGLSTDYMASLKYGNLGRLLAFKLGGTAELPKLELIDRTIPEQPILISTDYDIQRGTELYGQYCAMCHGSAVRAGSNIPDLRMMSEESHKLFKEIVYNGMLKENGMSSFSDVLSEKDVESIYHYIINIATSDRVVQIESGE